MLVVDTVSMLMAQWNWISSCIAEESWRGRRAFGISILRLNYVKLDVLKTSLARGLSICLTHILICRVFGIDLDFKSWHDMKYLFIRNSIIIFHQIVYAGLHFILPFPLVNSITITGPLFVFVIDYYINNITITKGQAVGILIGFTGVLININGEYIMSIIDPSFHF